MRFSNKIVQRTAHCNFLDMKLSVSKFYRT